MLCAVACVSLQIFTIFWKYRKKKNRKNKTWLTRPANLPDLYLIMSINPISTGLPLPPTGIPAFTGGSTLSSCCSIQRRFPWPGPTTCERAVWFWLRRCNNVTSGVQLLFSCGQEMWLRSRHRCKIGMFFRWNKGGFPTLKFLKKWKT